MGPSTEPTASDLSAVEAFLGGSQASQPAPQPAPVPEPAPAPQPAPQPEQPVQPTQPAAQPTPEPVAPVGTTVEPAAPAQPAETYQTYDEYMKSILGDIEPAPAAPDPTKIDPNSDEAIGNFFNELMETAVKRFEESQNRKQAIQNSERTLWDQAFQEYGVLRDNKQLRDIVHSIRMAEFNRGVAMTPKQAASRLFGILNDKYKQGIADNQVHTEIETVQPTAGGTSQVPTSLDTQRTLESLQHGGEDALAQFLDQEIKAGKI